MHESHENRTGVDTSQKRCKNMTDPVPIGNQLISTGYIGELYARYMAHRLGIIQLNNTVVQLLCNSGATNFCTMVE